MVEALKVSIELKEIPVILEGKDGEENGCLRELIGRERNKYLSKVTGRIKTDKTGKAVTLRSFEGMHSDLLGRCFYHENGELFTNEEIEELPSSTQQLLFDKAQELSGLNVNIEDEEKND